MAKLYPGMAFTNIKNNWKTYLPYMLSCSLTIALFYIIGSLGANKGISEMWGGDMIASYMTLGQGVTAIFAVIFLFYINSFLVKRRRSEFGLYNILGMEKKHICRVIFLETVYTFLITMAAGLILGILLDKLLYLVISHMLAAKVPLGFYISVSSILQSLALFGGIFLLMFLNSMRHIYRARPVDLLKSRRAGEKEPKAKWILAVAGVICLAAGYYIAVTTDNPVAAIAMFFIAVVLVIVGTYLVFTAGSIALLKLLKKNKGYYYKTKHFVSISAMMYRMKKNAVGLANICILSTMVLVIISTTLSMYLGVNDALKQRYPAEYNITCMVQDNDYFDQGVKALRDNARSEGLTLTHEIAYRDFSFSAIYEKSKDFFVTDPSLYSNFSAMQKYNQLTTFVVVPLEDYNKSMGINETLGENEVLAYSSRQALPTDTINVFNLSLHVKKTLPDFMANGNTAAKISSGHYLVVKDLSVIEKMKTGQNKALGDKADKFGSWLEINYMADVTGNAEKQKDQILAAYHKTWDDIQAMNDAADAAKSDAPQPSSIAMAKADPGFNGSLECRTNEEASFRGVYSGLFFVGIFLGILFLMATILIMYYKQITEGYEDKQRFTILQNVGMSHHEVKQTIRSQILTVFFLPLVTAGVHIGFAFPFLYRILTLMNLFNLRLFTLCTVGCFLAFALFYGVVYWLTSRIYYGIVKK
ncbi:MAG: ABC transporter permease [Lentihominibacter sp.]|uniref:ABC transporter permease n=1 Tax=Lentihominibacter sp. TaxID=2944216 RepID=UPI002A90C39B|nr:ABC transporter permease [Lentihominibacter sp.]MDY5286849.1 ABC transporter permease [Lentihominibacter sp.]